MNGVGVFPELSPRHARAAMCIARDMTPRQLANKLGVAVRTAHEYRYEVCCKLAVNGAAGVAAIAFRRGYLR